MAQTPTKNALPHHQLADIFFIHSQNIIKTKFPIPLTDQKRIGIKKKQKRKHSDHNTPKGKHDRQIGTANHLHERRGLDQVT